ncbi:DNA polymerase III subunit delta' [Parahaliea mediterranea]|uniref:DNA-directed DNA polymerase n=1 Tax=Parahaliea mediterranea TaxID=651086 RepID=A0A939DG75_9GAMM|nr:DNA polymerase III subunit delta' [Parahaliea mediterranea]MBN7797720.1 DNA polymerase III subunit delta' [Parahaliea mediterranea]
MELSGLPAISAPLPWQGEAWSRWHQQLEQGRLPHALLLAGSPGIGKARLALALARLLLCHRPSAGHNCGECSACELSRSGAHGDFRWLQPEGESRVIKIDQIRQGVDFANWTAGFGQRKVLVIAPADSMNTNAANALLKSLEEPAANTHLVLVCHRLHGVPATIRSRCQLLKLPLPPAEAALQWLDSVTGDRQVSADLLQLAEGRPLAAEALYRESAADGALALRAALDALVAGRAAVPELLPLLGELSAAELLAMLAAYTEAHIRGMDAGALAREGRDAFALLDALRQQQAAVAGGSNPNRQLLCESLLLRLREGLGMAPGRC